MPPSKTRTSGHKRSLTQIDLDVIRAIYYFRSLYGYQIRTLFNFSMTSKYPNHRLGYLVKNQYLERKYNQLNPDNHRAHAFFMMARKSKQLISQMENIPLVCVKWNKRENNILYSTHTKEVNDFAIRVKKQSPLPVSFISEILATDRFEYNQKKRIIRPDGLLTFYRGHQRGFYFIEREFSRESANHFIKKLQNYLDYQESFQRKYHTSSDFVVLIIANNDSHKEHLRTIAQSLYRTNLFLFATWPELQQQHVFGQCWKGLVNDHPLPLFL